MNVLRVLMCKRGVVIIITMMVVVVVVVVKGGIQLHQQTHRETGLVLDGIIEIVPITTTQQHQQQ